MASGILEPGNGLGAHPATFVPQNAFRIGLHLRQVVMLHVNAALPKLLDSLINIIHQKIENRMLGRMIVG